MEEKIIIKGIFFENEIVKRNIFFGIIMLVIGIICISNDGEGYYAGIVLTVLGGLCLLVALAFGLVNHEMVVTNRRVYGKTNIGKRVDLPLDSITAIGLNIFDSIAVTTASGAIKLAFMNNRDEVYNEICKLICERQEAKSIATITQENKSDEGELQKDIPDNKAITQEEINAKQPQNLEYCESQDVSTLKEINQTKEQVMSFVCPNCNSEVNFGDESCKKCGLKFDWGKL